MSALIIVPPPPPTPVTIQQIYPDTTLDLMYAIYSQLGGVVIEERYKDRGDDILYAIWKILQGGGTSFPPSVNQGTRLVTGNATWSGTGLIFDITQCTYFINNVFKTSPAAQVTLAAAHPTLNRIDVIFVNATNVAGVLTGTPAPSPVKPLVNTATQCEVTFILVEAGAVTPANITNEVIYAEHVEWQTTSFLGATSTVDFENTTSPDTGLKNIDVNLGAGETVYFDFKKGPVFNVADYNFLRLKVRIDNINSLNASQYLFEFGFFRNGQLIAQSGISNGMYGFNATAIGWQLVSIPLSAIGFAFPTFDQFYIKVAEAGITEFSLDNILLQGTGPQSPNGDIILISQLGNPYRLEVFEDGDGAGILTTTRI